MKLIPLFLLSLATLNAAPISWGTATTVADDSDVATSGHLLHAEHWGGADATVNGVVACPRSLSQLL